MQSITRWCLAHRRIVIVGWIVILIGTVALASGAGTAYKNVFQLPGTESQRARDLLEQRFPQRSGDSDQIVFHVGSGTLRDAPARARIAATLKDVKAVPEVAEVVSPFGAGQGAISKDGRTGFATVNFQKDVDKLNMDHIKQVVDRAQSHAGGGLQVELTGQAIEQERQQQGGPSEGIGVLAAAVVLIMTFGSLVAAGMPLLVALISLGTGISLVGLLSHSMNVADFAPQLAAMIGLGVGIDYALFILTRYREELAVGRSYHDAADAAMGTAGRAVLFAGVTVCIALLGMMLLGVSFLYGVSIAAAIAVVLVMSASLTLLPALLVALGPKIDRLRLGRKVRPVRIAGQGGSWERWSHTVARHPWRAAVTSLIVLLVLAAPVLTMRLGSSDAGTDPSGSTTRKAYDLLSEGFGPGFSGPLLLAVELPKGGGNDTASLAKLKQAVARDAGVASVTAPQLNASGDVAVLEAFPKTSPQSAATKDLVNRLRDTTIPPVAQETGMRVSMGGATATITDFTHVVASKLPLFIGIVVLLSMLLLAILFRSIWIPVKAAFMNVLSIAAALGMVTAVFQHGWGASLIGVDATGPIESFLPVMLFAIVFGLSMDYEVFLMSRVHEEWERTKDADVAVTRGLAATGRVITAAAAIMVLVFGSFMLGGDRVIKLFGLGLAGAVFIDAFLIRVLLVPAVLHLLGARAWWLPRWMDRVLPEIKLELPQEPVVGASADGAGGAAAEPEPVGSEA